MRSMILLVWRQEGPTMPIAAFGCVIAYFSSSADIGSALATLSTPTGSGKLVVLKDVSELFLIVIEFKTQDSLKKVSGITA